MLPFGVGWAGCLPRKRLHSLLDGMGIGFASQIDARAGWLVALAVLTHDLADGVNTVGPCLAAEADDAARR